MSKFKAYVINEYQADAGTTPRGKMLSSREAAKIINGKCQRSWRQWMEESSWISRITFSGRDDFSFLDSRKDKDRMSKNTPNYYTHIINNDPTWKSFPRRQIIATAGFRDSVSSKNVYCIFPFDGTKIGVCSSSDIWVSFDALKKNQISANSLNHFIRDMLSKADGASKQYYDESWGEFKRQCKVFDFWFQAKDLENKEERKMATAMRKYELLSEVEYYDFRWVFDFYNDNLYKALTQIYSPKGFKVIKSGMTDLPIQKSSEIWFDGACVLIESPIAVSMRKNSPI
jgi:hypothetical protein